MLNRPIFACITVEVLLLKRRSILIFFCSRFTLAGFGVNDGPVDHIQIIIKVT